MNVTETIKSLLGMYLEGVDISSYQDDDTTPQQIDWDTLATKANFAFIRCYRSNGTIDSDFARNWSESKRAGVPRGAYAFLYPSLDATKAAFKFVTALGNDLGELPPVADYEYESWSSPGTGRLYLKNFLEEVLRLTGKRCLIYTRQDIWQKWGSADIYWRQYPLWVARWGVVAPSVFAPWTDWLFWQYGTPVISPAEWGVESKEIDADRFNGDLAKFRAAFGITDTTPPPPPPDIPEQYPPVIGVVSIDPEPTKLTLINLDVTLADGQRVPYVVHYSPKITPPVEPPLTALYRIKDDLQAGIIPSGTRPYIRKGTACTVRMQGVNAAVTVPQTWVDWLKSVNTARGYSYLFNRDSGWHNGPASPLDQPLKVETVLMGGNVIEVMRVDGNRAFFRCVHPSDTPPAKIIPSPLSNPLIHNFTIQYSTHLDYDINGRIPLILPMAPDGQEPWIDIRELIKL